VDEKNGPKEAMAVRTPVVPNLFDQMTELYPHWVANQSWLMFGFPQP